jgi:Protein of unknown function (DUF732)
MKKIFAVLGIVALLFIAGCSNEPTVPKAEVTPIQTFPAPQQPQYQPPVQNTDDIFLSVIRQKISYGTDAEVIELAGLICKAFDVAPVRTAFETSANAGINAGLSPTDVGYIIGASVAAYCPQYQGQLEQLLETY